MPLQLLDAAQFAAEKHKLQRRKDPAATPYINHPIRVAYILNEAGIYHISVLCAALLHDTVEDTDTSPEELAERFGTDVSDIVMEVTDDKSLPKAERKRLQVEHARNLSHGAGLVKIGDKIANVADIISAPPVGWSLDRQQAYFEWSRDVVFSIPGRHKGLELTFQNTYERGMRHIVQLRDAES
jgi:guanosine-3',5'-bis(diphosphate) 3'-pyrophosphohydrolase